MSRKPTIGELIEREERGEDLQLRPDYQVMFVAMKEALKVLEANDGDDLSDFIFNFIWVSPLPMRGRTRKSAELLKAEADALAWGREQIEEFRGPYHAPRDLSLETITTLCLSGPAAEDLFCGPSNDGGAEIDFQMARQILARHFDPLRAAAELSRCRTAAERLVRSAWAQQRIRLLADALLRCGTLSGEEIHQI